MMTFSETTVMGYVGRKPELRKTPNGVPFASFSVAHTKRIRDDKASDGYREETTWYNCEFWREAAEHVVKHVDVGSKIFVRGELKARKYTDRKGQTDVSLDIQVRDYRLLDAKSKSGELPAAYAATAGAGTHDDEPAF